MKWVQGPTGAVSRLRCAKDAKHTACDGETFTLRRCGDRVFLVCLQCFATYEVSAVLKTEVTEG